jgi:hypothetical protein
MYYDFPAIYFLETYCNYNIKYKNNYYYENSSNNNINNINNNDNIYYIMATDALI